MKTGQHTTNSHPEIWGGIECTINRVKNVYFDQLQYSQHYTRESDIHQIAGLGIKKIRYPVLWEKHQPHRSSRIDWTWTEKQFALLKEKGVEIIAGLTHHGSGPRFTNLADASYPYLLSAYAKQVAERFPSLKYYTPVNEPLTTARFSGLYGIWYPHRKNAKSFVKMLLNQVKGIILSMQEIRKMNPDAQLVQTEDLGKTYSTPELKYQADFDNERRWLTYDLLCGKVNEDHPLWNYLIGLKIPTKEFDFFLDNVCIPNIFGFNHYVTSERFLDHRANLYPFHFNSRLPKFVDVEAVRSQLNEDSGIAVLLKEAWDRYHQPIAVTEVHLHCHREEQLRWFKHVYNTAHVLIQEGVNIKAVTAWALLGSYGWSDLLTQPKGIYEPGVFDLRGGIPRPTALVGFIRDINHKDTHPACSGEGWWERHNRFIHEPSFKKTIEMQKKTEQPPVIIIGKTGTLGMAFARICEGRNLNYKLLSRQQCDIANLQCIKNMIELYNPWAIINTAGYVKVDDAEKENEKCFRENTTGPYNLAIACTQSAVKLVSFSSDLVFDGRKNKPYVEADIPNPLNIYGQSKCQCEELVRKENPDALMIRTSAFFGPWDEYNFVHHVRKTLSQFETITVANDIHISPTYIPDLVHTTLDLLIDGEKGIWHLTNKGEITWSQLAAEIAGYFGLEKKLIIALPKNEILFKAKRPAYSVMTSERAILLPGLDDAMQRYYNESRAINLLSKTA